MSAVSVIHNAGRGQILGCSVWGPVYESHRHCGVQNIFGGVFVFFPNDRFTLNKILQEVFVTQIIIRPHYWEVWDQHLAFS